MREPINLQDPNYTPVKLLNEAAWYLNCPHDSALARILEVNRALLSRIRHRQTPISAHILIQIADRTEWSVKHLRALAGVPFDGGSARAERALNFDRMARLAFLRGEGPDTAGRVYDRKTQVGTNCSEPTNIKTKVLTK